MINYLSDAAIRLCERRYQGAFATSLAENAMNSGLAFALLRKNTERLLLQLGFLISFVFCKLRKKGNHCRIT